MTAYAWAEQVIAVRLASASSLRRSFAIETGAYNAKVKANVEEPLDCEQFCSPQE